MVERLADDHRRARSLAESVADIPGLAVDLDTVQTNLVRVDLTEPGVTSYDIAAGLAGHGIAIHAFERDAFKFALHYEITDDHLPRVATAATKVMEALRDRPARPAEPVGAG